MPTPLSDLGEFKLIGHLMEKVKLNDKSVKQGVGDDAAVIDNGKEFLLVTTDMLTEGVHFDLTYMPPKHLGYKSVIVNLSDIYAMNGTPKYFTLSLAVSNRMSVEFLEELYEGIQLACELYNVSLVGGDTTSSQSGLVIGVTAFGSVEKDRVVYRHTGKPTDLICVSGDLGASYIGFHLLERERAVNDGGEKVEPDFSGKEYLLERQLKPEARREVIEMLRDKDVVPTSMIDVSDGLSSDLMHLCTGSGLGCHIYQEKIPIDATTSMTAEEFNMAPETAALNGGEDYELLFTVDIKEHEKIQALQGIHIIGHMTEKNDGCYLITPQDQAIPIAPDGWDSVGKGE